MPSAELLQASINRVLPELSFQSHPSRPNEVLISLLSTCAAGEDFVGSFGPVLASGTYGAANKAVGFMFGLGDSFTVQKVWWANATTATTNNADVAVYTEDGAKRIIAAGSTLIAGANIIQEVDVTDTVLPGGQRYWCVYNQDGTTATPAAFTFTSSGLASLVGIGEFAGAVPLGATFTPADLGTNVVPFFGIAGRTQVA